jgi:hypothetical protein
MKKYKILRYLGILISAAGFVGLGFTATPKAPILLVAIVALGSFAVFIGGGYLFKYSDDKLEKLNKPSANDQKVESTLYLASKKFS